MLTRTLKPNDMLQVGDAGTLYLVPNVGDDDQTLFTISQNRTGMFLHVGGCNIYIEQPSVTFSTLENSWFKVEFAPSQSVGFKVFNTDRNGRPFAGNAIRVIIDAPSEVEITQC